MFGNHIQFLYDDINCTLEFSTNTEHQGLGPINFGASMKKVSVHFPHGTCITRFQLFFG